MNIVQLQRLRTASLGGDDKPRGLPRPGGPEGIGFGSALDHAIGQVDQAQKAAADQVTAFIAGDQENLHEVCVSTKRKNTANSPDGFSRNACRCASSAPPLF